MIRTICQNVSPTPLSFLPYVCSKRYDIRHLKCGRDWPYIRFWTHELAQGFSTEILGCTVVFFGQLGTGAGQGSMLLCQDCWRLGNLRLNSLPQTRFRDSRLVSCKPSFWAFHISISCNTLIISYLSIHVYEMYSVCIYIYMYMYIDGYRHT